MDVRDAEVWQLVGLRLDDVRRLPYDELLRRTGSPPEVELLERPAGTFGRRTRVVALLTTAWASPSASTCRDAGDRPSARS
jgi:hypothetical protein